MSSFQQSCPSCNVALELPIEADGKTAVCPACQVQFIAAVPSVSQSNLAAVVTPNPPVVPVKSVRQIPIERIWVDAQSVFSERRRPLLLPFLLPSVLVLLGFVFPLVYLSDLAAVNRARAMVWLAVGSPWFLLVTVYSVWFALNLALDVCDAGPDEEGEAPETTRSWFIPNAAVFFALLVALTIGIAFAAVIVGLAITIIDAVNNVQTFEIRLLITVGAFVGVIVLLTFSAMRLWPVIPLAMDGRFGGVVVRESLTMTRANQMTSFFLVVGIFFTLGFGFSLFGLGLPLVTPLAALMLVVAFRLIEGRSIPALDGDGM